MMKEPNTQRAFNKSIKNEDALYKQLAYGAIVEQQYKEQYYNPDHVTFKDKEVILNPHTFERWYIEQLSMEAHREPRSINPEDYEPK